MSLRIHSLSVTRQGGPEKQRELDENTSAMVAAQRKWQEQLQADKGKPWNACPDAMVADLVRAAAQDMFTEYEQQAVVKALQILAGVALGHGHERLDLAASWPQANAHLHLTMDLVTHETRELGVDLDIAAPADMAPDQVLEQIAQPGPVAARLPLDPLVAGILPDRQVAMITHAMAELLSDDFAVLAGAAAVLLAWKQMEEFGTDSLALTIGGLHANGTVLRPGQDVRFQAQARLMDAAMVSDDAGDTRRMTASFRAKRNG